MEENNVSPHSPLTTIVNGSEFTWDHEQGRFQFEGDDVVLFWVTSAFRTFLKPLRKYPGRKRMRLCWKPPGTAPVKL